MPESAPIWLSKPNDEKRDNKEKKPKKYKRTMTLRLPRADESSHFLVMGDTGSGKSALIRQILIQVQQRNETAIVYDPALEFVPQFYDASRGDFILNPLDQRCPFWTPADELTTSDVQLLAESLTIAASLFPEIPNDRNKFFADRARQLFAHLLSLRPSPQQLTFWMRTERELDRLVKGTPNESTLDKNAAPTRGNMISELNRVADTLNLLPEEKHTAQRWSVKQWAQKRQGWLFLTSTPQTRKRLRPLTSMWLDQLVLATMTSSSRPVWFIFNEFASLQKMDQAQTALIEQRKSCNPIIIDIQSRSQMKDLYGIVADGMMSQPAFKFFFGTADADSNEWIAKTIGKQEIEYTQESYNGRTLNRTLRREEVWLFMPSEIGGLQPMHCVLKHRNDVVEMRIPWIELPKKAEAFVLRSTPKAQIVAQSIEFPEQEPAVDIEHEFHR